MKTLAITFAVALAACAEAPASQVAGETVAKTDWVLADYTKPGAPVSLAYRDVKRVEPGDAPEIVLRVGSLAPNSLVEIELGATPGVDILGTSKRIVQTDASGTAIVTVDVRALTEGRHYVEVAAGTGEMGMRRLSIPVQVGDGAPAMKPAPGTLATDGEGRAILVMDAEETVDGQPR